MDKVLYRKILSCMDVRNVVMTFVQVVKVKVKTKLRKMMIQKRHAELAMALSINIYTSHCTLIKKLKCNNYFYCLFLVYFLHPLFHPSSSPSFFFLFIFLFIRNSYELHIFLFLTNRITRQRNRHWMSSYHFHIIQTDTFMPFCKITQDF